MSSSKNVTERQGSRENLIQGKDTEMHTWTGSASVLFYSFLSFYFPCSQPFFKDVNFDFKAEISCVNHVAQHQLLFYAFSTAINTTFFIPFYGLHILWLYTSNYSIFYYSVQYIHVLYCMYCTYCTSTFSCSMTNQQYYCFHILYIQYSAMRRWLVLLFLQKETVPPPRAQSSYQFSSLSDPVCSPPPPPHITFSICFLFLFHFPLSID